MNELIDKLFASVIKPKKHYLLDKVIRIKKNNIYSYWTVINTNPYSRNLFLITPISYFDEDYNREEYWFNINDNSIQEVIVHRIPNN